jgi:hypothetical protein
MELKTTATFEGCGGFLFDLSCRQPTFSFDPRQNPGQTKVFDTIKEVKSD